MAVVKRFEVHLAALDPTVGREIKKQRPCLVISPDSLNQYLDTIIVAPLTSRRKPYPSRVNCRFQGKSGQIALDQLRSIDRQRLVRRLGRLSPATNQRVLNILAELFAA